MSFGYLKQRESLLERYIIVLRIKEKAWAPGLKRTGIMMKESQDLGNKNGWSLFRTSLLG